MKTVVRYMKLLLPRSPEQIQIRRDLSTLGHHLEIEAATMFKSCLPSEVLAAQSIKGAGKSIGLLSVVPRTSFRTMGPHAIEVTRRYFDIAQKAIVDGKFEFRRTQFERLAAQLQP